MIGKPHGERLDVNRLERAFELHVDRCIDNIVWIARSPQPDEANAAFAVTVPAQFRHRYHAKGTEGTEETVPFPPYPPLPFPPFPPFISFHDRCCTRRG